MTDDYMQTKISVACHDDTPSYGVWINQDLPEPVNASLAIEQEGQTTQVLEFQVQPGPMRGTVRPLPELEDTPTTFTLYGPQYEVWYTTTETLDCYPNQEATIAETAPPTPVGDAWLGGVLTIIGILRTITSRIT